MNKTTVTHTKTKVKGPASCIKHFFKQLGFSISINISDRINVKKK